MWADGVRVLHDVSAGDWIRPRLGAWGSIGGVVPLGYEAYARVLHPAPGPEGSWVRWSDVAAVTGRAVHPRVQWHRLIGSDDPWNPESELWPYPNPYRGTLPPNPLAELRDVLAPRTTAVDCCYFAVWEGWGDLNGSSWVTTIYTDDVTGAVTGHSVEQLPRAFTSTEWTATRLTLPGRDYLLLEGPLSAVVGFAQGEGRLDDLTRSPNLWWPADRAWCVASEIDYDSTLVGGDAATIAAVLAAPGLEAWPIEPDDVLWSDSDHVNT